MIHGGSPTSLLILALTGIQLSLNLLGVLGVSSHTGDGTFISGGVVQVQIRVSHDVK